MNERRGSCCIELSAAAFFRAPMQQGMPAGQNVPGSLLRSAAAGVDRRDQGVDRSASRVYNTTVPVYGPGKSFGQNALEENANDDG